ncbi:hypothetical protein NDU88_002450 [Pleurodeles waltl]|uniref:Uncharacterized protein n=1 Tax=Pleurodeles waltl TaxID=8319 RepID=A0AAV7U9U2_PLEWA|nr:hypothetical protein NDU88_002450 [Pleurodeles waltl]
MVHNKPTQPPKGGITQGAVGALTQDTPQAVAKGLESHTAITLAASKDTNEALKRKVEIVAHDMNLLREDHRKLVNGVVVKESTLMQTQPTVLDQDGQILRLEK